MCTATACGKAARGQDFASLACENDLFRLGMSQREYFPCPVAGEKNYALQMYDVIPGRAKREPGMTVLNQLTPRKSRLPTSTPLCRRMPWAVVAWK
jgi:hypothetical protein